MKKEINQILTFLFSEYKRLKIKEKNKNITNEEKDTLKKISAFIGKEDAK